LIHEYKITNYSLYGALSIGLTTEMILKILKNLSKLIIDKNVEKFIIDNTKFCGQLILILKNGLYKLESKRKDLIKKIITKSNLTFELKEYIPFDNNDIRYYFEIEPNYIETIKKICDTLKLPLIEEFDYINDKKNKLEISIDNNIKIRDYQQQCLDKIFSFGVVRSGIFLSLKLGIVVLPCNLNFKNLKVGLVKH
jgi:DNA excision repair protein ERCC-3